MGWVGDEPETLATAHSSSAEGSRQHISNEGACTRLAGSRWSVTSRMTTPWTGRRRVLLTHEDPGLDTHVGGRVERFARVGYCAFMTLRRGRRGAATDPDDLCRVGMRLRLPTHPGPWPPGQARRHRGRVDGEVLTRRTVICSPLRRVTPLRSTWIYRIFLYR